MSTTLAAASASQYSAIQSCGSICVVYGLHSRPSDSMNVRLTAGQSTAGSAATCALKLPTAPFHLPRMLTAAQRRCARRKRAAKLAISFPSVVGLAACPWVRAGEDGGSQGRSGKRRNRHRQMQQPSALDPHALADETGFGEQLAQRRGSRTVASIDGRESLEGREGIAGARGHALRDA